MLSTQNRIVKLVAMGMVLALALMALADGTTTTRDPNGPGWVSTTTRDNLDKDGKKVVGKDGKNVQEKIKEKVTDAKGNITKETNFSDGKKTKETDFEWSENMEGMVVRHERFYDGDGKEVAGRDFNKDGVIQRKWVKWSDGTSNETIYDKNGKPKTRKSFDKDGKLVKEQDLSNMDLRPEPPTVFSGGGARVGGIVIGLPERFAANEPISFRVVRVDGQVIPNEKVDITNGQGETVSASTNQNGVVSTRIPAGWSDAVVSVLGARSVSYVASTGVPHSPIRLSGAPKFIEPGSVVSLNGTNFEPDLLGNTVTIGGQPARVIGATSNSLSVLVPTGATPGSASISVANDSGTATGSSTVISIEVMPGQGTLLQGQRTVRMVRVVGTQESLPILVTDPAGDAARVENPGTLYSSGGPDNTVQIGVASLKTGTYSFMVGLDPDFWDRVVDSLERSVQAGHVARAKERAEAAAHQANVDEFFGTADEARGSRERNAAREWRAAAKSWRDAMHAWQDGDAKAAEAAEADALGHEGKARDAHWK